ncbi:MAG: hypothetical protein DHS20C16_28480 [Phycisphaerae bacterium]|nr:MAG: hypothetical protein DHS20C16_28480 [Phycisphaerae bacterium]
MSSTAAATKANTALKRRALRFDSWADVLADADQLASSGYDRVGQLSLGQNCSHLAIVLECALDGFPTRWPLPMRLIARWLVLPKMLRHEPTKLKVKAPAFAKQEEPVDDAVGVERLRKAIGRFSAPDAEYVDHLVFGKLTPDQWKHQQLWHCEHHLSFLIPK